MLSLYCTAVKLWLSIDNYVHRLVQTKAGGKMVEVSGSGEAVSVQQALYLWWQLIRIIV